MRAARPAAVLLAGLLVAAGARAADPPGDAASEVMSLLFGAADASGAFPLPNLTLAADAPANLRTDWHDRAATLRPLAWRETKTGNVRRGVLLTEATGLDERGRAIDCHACPALLSMYRVEFAASGWQLREAHVGFAESGAFGRAGQARFAAIGPRRTGIVVTHVGGGQGLFAESLRLFELSGARVVARSAEPLTLAAENSGACADDEPSLPPCYAYHGRWDFDREQTIEGLWPLRVRFDGTRPGSDGRPLAVEPGATWIPRQGLYVPAP